MVLLVLAVIWAAVLVPPALRARAEASPVDSIGKFRQHLRVLQRTSPYARADAVGGFPAPAPTPTYHLARTWSASPATARRARTLKRRRDVFITLLGGMGATLVLGLFPPLRVLLWLHLVLDVLFAGYVALLVRSRNLAAEREMKLRFLPQPAPAHARAENVLLFRRPAN